MMLGWAFTGFVELLVLLHCLILSQTSPVYSHGHGGMQKKEW